MRTPAQCSSASVHEIRSCVSQTSPRRNRSRSCAGSRRASSVPSYSSSGALNSVLEQVPEPVLRQATLLWCRHVHPWEFLAPMPGPAGIDDGAAVGVVADRLAFGLDARVQRSRPGIADDVDRGCRIGAREHRPDELLQVRHIDVLVDHDHIAPAIGADMAHGRDMAGLPGVAGISLIDRDREQKPGAADLMRPRRGDARHARLLDILAQQRRTHHRTITANFIRGALRRATQQDRSIAIIDGLDIEHRLGPQITRVIAGPFAERPLGALVAGHDEAFEHDLRVGRNRQTGDGAFDHIHGPAPQAADDLILAHAVWHLAARHQEGHGVAAAYHCDRHRLAARAIFVAHLAPVLAGRDIKPRGPGVMDHHAVSAAIGPALVRITGDVEAAGADITAAVGLVPLRRREACYIDVVTTHDVLEDRAVTDVAGRNPFHRGHAMNSEGLAQLDFGKIGREAERHVLALAAKEVDEHPAALDRARYLVEYEAGGSVVVQSEFRYHADVLLPR